MRSSPLIGVIYVVSSGVVVKSCTAVPTVAFDGPLGYIDLSRALPSSNRGITWSTNYSLRHVIY